MNRRVSIIVTAFAAVGVFTAGKYLFTSGNEENPASNRVASEVPLLRPHAPVFGPIDAPVTIVEFFDPACESCRAFYPIVKLIMNAFPGQVRVVLRYAAFHPQSEQAIRIIEAARLQGKFEIVLEKLLGAQQEWAPHGRPADNVWNVLEGTGLDIERARNDAITATIEEVVRQDALDVATVNVSRTPTFFVNGMPLQEFGAQQLYDLVRSEVEAL